MSILDLFFPRRCVSCNKAGSYICQKCRDNISRYDYQFCFACRNPSLNGVTHFRCLRKNCLDGIFMGARYSGSVKKAIHLMKYRFVSDLIPEVTGILFRNYPSFLKTFGLILPVPLHQKKLKQRGFNQAYLIGKTIAKKLNIPIQENVIIRSKNTKPQFELKVDERKINVKNVFHIADINKVRNKKICLVDDVTTTFSTLNECSGALKSAGAKQVWAIVLAHGN